jgi:WD40 repeat protein
MSQPPPTRSQTLPATISHALGPDNPVSVGPDSEGAPPAVEGYEILGVLGRGGMGVVYKARQLALKRIVALKMILAGGHAGPEQRARFRGEAEAVARLQHPHIVQIHEIGEADGCAFISLEHLEGGTLTQKLRGLPQPPAEAAGLVRTLAQALHHAHERGVVHRDLKPGNVLLAADGTPRITDFGLARLVEAGPGLTATGAILGTPSYMAPEQAEGKKEVGAAADVYALGAILYECLTGRPPFLAATALETVQQVLTQEPVPPRRLQPGTPRDLEVICLHCLRKEPGRRYGTAGHLAEDLRRFEAGEPIVARPTGLLERTRKWVKRRPALASLLAVSAAALLALLGGGVYFTSELQAERDTAQWERDQAQTQERRAEGLRKRAEKGETEAKERLDLANRMLLTAQLWRVATLWERDPVQGLARLEDPQRCPPRLRDFTWGFYHRLCNRLRFRLTGHDAPITSVAFTRDSLTLATASAGRVDGKGPRVGVVKFWDMATGRERATFKDPASGFTSVAFSPDGLTLAMAGSDATVKLWDVARGEVRAVLRGHKSRVLTVAFSPDGATLASAGSDKTVNLWDVRTLKERASLGGHLGQIQCVAFSLDGRTLASAGHSTREGELRLWDVASGKPRGILKGHTSGVMSVAFSPDGRTLASGGTDFALRLWDLAAQKERAVFHGLGVGPIHALAFAPDGQTLATGGAQGLLILWDVATGQQRTVLKGHIGDDLSVAYSPDGKLLASATGQSHAPFDVLVWNVVTGQHGVTLREKDDVVMALAYSGDGTILASGDGEEVALWDVATGKRRAALVGHRERVFRIALSKDGQTLAAGDLEQVKVWDVAKRRVRFTVAGRSSLGLSSDGKLLATLGKDGTVRLWDTTTGKERASRPDPFGHVALSADGKLLAASGHGRTIRLFDVATWRELGRMDGAGSVVFSPDARLLANITGGTIILWDVATRRKHVILKGHDGSIQQVAFSPDGRTLASACSGRNEIVAGELKLWDVTTGEERADLKGHRSVVSAVAFAPDGRTLASGSWDGAIKLWYADPYRAGK